jgi:hypothetical protein
MRRLIVTMAIAVVMALGVVGPAAANPPNPACNGLDRAHTNVHETGPDVPPEVVLHDLRAANHCGH